jgi:hypothetical protein
MNMVVGAADRDRVHAMVRRDTCHVGPLFRLEFFLDQLRAISCAEDDVNVIAHVRAGHCLVPAGLNPSNVILPGTSGERTINNSLFSPPELPSRMTEEQVVSCIKLLMETR